MERYLGSSALTTSILTDLADDSLVFVHHKDCPVQILMPSEVHFLLGFFKRHNSVEKGSIHGNGGVLLQRDHQIFDLDRFHLNPPFLLCVMNSDTQMSSVGLWRPLTVGRCAFSEQKPDNLLHIFAKKHTRFLRGCQSQTHVNRRRLLITPEDEKRKRPGITKASRSCPLQKTPIPFASASALGQPPGRFHGKTVSRGLPPVPRRGFIPRRLFHTYCDKTPPECTHCLLRVLRALRGETDVSLTTKITKCTKRGKNT